MKCSSCTLRKEKEHLMNIWLVVIYINHLHTIKVVITFQPNALFSIQAYKCSL